MKPQFKKTLRKIYFNDRFTIISKYYKQKNFKSLHVYPTFLLEKFFYSDQICSQFLNSLLILTLYLIWLQALQDVDIDELAQLRISIYTHQIVFHILLY